MKKGDLVYIVPRNSKGKGVIMAYENFIICTDLKTGERKGFGDRDYHWCDPIGKIEQLQEALAKIKHIAQFP